LGVSYIRKEDGGVRDQKGRHACLHTEIQQVASTISRPHERRSKEECQILHRHFIGGRLCLDPVPKKGGSGQIFQKGKGGRRWHGHGRTDASAGRPDRAWRDGMPTAFGRRRSWRRAGYRGPWALEGLPVRPFSVSPPLLSRYLCGSCRKPNTAGLVKRVIGRPVNDGVGQGPQVLLEHGREHVDITPLGRIQPRSGRTLQHERQGGRIRGRARHDVPPVTKLQGQRVGLAIGAGDPVQALHIQT
jgi:hypothetical protein